MTRKDYVMVANAFNKVYNYLPKDGVKGYFLEFMREMADAFEVQNDRFNRSIFYSHCIKEQDNEPF